jgi:hypothetical protein
MKHYKDTQNNLYGYEVGDDMPAGLIEITMDQVHEINAAKVQFNANAERIAELKALLTNSDYKVLPDYDKPDENIVAQRQAWREEIRTLEVQA